ncbi:rod shape-determining protein MreD [Nocardioides sp. BP30]|uniref:rod shape-determining protein MreD n=1 Tax=Nocardioides sp. BP30 TaxID=3036374 RepID=UPI002469058F|nr:rod shape-determining protein MreD [Nocardioides sp. BP30]WGL53575.1 rod shape-determining protein MreD [Nocardioides sp. BP30]
MTGRWMAMSGLLVAVALLLQVSLFDAFAWQGVVPDLVLMVVVAAALSRGCQTGMVLGFAAGLLMDLAPPADHLAGRWALALMIAGYVAGRVRQDAGRASVVAVMATMAACSLVATTVFGLSGMVLRDPALGFGEVLRVIGIGLVWDVLLTPLVLPALLALYGRAEALRAR